MRILVVIALLAFGADLFSDDGERDGRRGNKLYEDGAYDEAAEAFASGLAALSEDASMRLRYGLHNNFGAALMKSGDAAGARQAFERALGAAVADVDEARSAYNAGNAAFTSDDLEAAVDFYRRSLLRNPDNPDAKFNFEFAKRRIEQQENQQEQQQGDSDQSDENQEEQNQRNSGEQNQNGEEQQDERNGQEDGSQQEEIGEPQEEDAPPREQSGESSQDRLSNAQAERILQALQNEEEQLLRQVQRPASRPRRVEKDW